MVEILATEYGWWHAKDVGASDAYKEWLAWYLSSAPDEPFVRFDEYVKANG